MRRGGRRPRLADRRKILLRRRLPHRHASDRPVRIAQELNPKAWVQLPQAEAHAALGQKVVKRLSGEQERKRAVFQQRRGLAD